MVKLKFLSIFLLSCLFFTFAAHSAHAASLITVDDKGKVVWQVLGTETGLSIPKPAEIKVTSVTTNETPSPNSQISLNNQNGKIELNVTDNGQTQSVDVTNLNQSLVELVQRGNTNDLKITTSGNQFNIEENGITAVTSFPITIDPKKNELSVTTNSGTRLISILPYEGALVLIRGKFIDSVNGNKINLTENTNGQLEYSINGKRQINLFNVATVTADISANVSASTGEILALNEPQWLKFFGFIWQ